MTQPNPESNYWQQYQPAPTQQPSQPGAPGYPQAQYPQQFPQQYGYPYQEPKHSGMGMASLAIGVIVGIMEMALVVIAGVMSAKAGPRGMDEKAPATIALGLLLLGGLLLALLGAALGVAGCLQPNRKRLFAILGLSINGLILLIVVGLMLIGLMVK